MTRPVRTVTDGERRPAYPSAWARSGGTRADVEAALPARSVSAGGLAADGAGWVERACAQVLAERWVRPESPAAPPAPVASRVLTVLAATGQVVRGDNGGSWTASRPVWTVVEDWVDQATQPRPEAEATPSW